MITQVLVTIPASNEQDDIGACLGSVGEACVALERRHGRRSRVVVALDTCTDDTAGVVAAFPSVQTVAIDARCVGRARRRAAERALATTTYLPADVWLASTDADCVVPVDWLIAMVEHADAGADLVLGTVRPSDGLHDAVHAAWLDRHERRDGHPHVHGANLGIRASTYLTLGGWPELPLHEDAELVARAVAAGRWNVHRSGDAPVITSSRLSGRVQDGFAGYLRALAPLVTSVPLAAPVQVLAMAADCETDPLLPRRCG